MNVSKNNSFHLKISPAKLSWKNGNPYSESFEDHFFAQEGGYEESKYVFLAQNGLPGRWSEQCSNQGPDQQADKKQSRFVIGETGFGTGLNFLTTVEAWLNHAPPERQLHYISIEKHPFEIEDLRKIYQTWGALSALGRDLLEVYPSMLGGFHRRYLFDNRIVLTLVFADVAEALPQISAQVDAWYLDGFAPSKNPGMWTAELFEQLVLHSAKNTTFSTFTAAGFVRRGLIEAGFKVEKFPGFGQKREMLRGELLDAVVDRRLPPWFRYQGKSYKQKSVMVIGGGIAGTTTAATFARRGWRVTLLDENKQLASAASGNPAGVVAPHWSTSVLHWDNFSTAAFVHAIAEYKIHAGEAWHNSAVMQLLSEEQLGRFEGEDLYGFVEFLSQQAVVEISGIASRKASALLTAAGFLQPQVFCTELLSNSGVTLTMGKAVRRLEYRDDQWLALDENEDELASASVVVLCNAYGAHSLFSEYQLELIKIRGQLSFLNNTKCLQNLSMPVCDDGYIMPTVEGVNIVGATFQPGDSDKAVRPLDHEENLHRLKKIVAVDEDLDVVGGRTAFRTSTLDHMPLIGPLYDDAFFRQHYGDLQHGRPLSNYPSPESVPGLFVNLAHGSRGLSTAPLAAEIIADYVEGTPQTVCIKNLQGLHSARFVVRDLKRGKAST